MDSQLRDQVVFHLTGRREAAEPATAVAGLRPALLAQYRKLDALRYDFPVVLADGPDCVQSLTRLVDAALRATAPEGPTGEGMRRRAIKIESELRRLVSGGARGTLTELWNEALQSLAADEAFAKDAAKIRAAVKVDGPVAGCNAELPSRLLRHVWSVVQGEKARAARARIGGLVIRLENILRADYMRSPQAAQKKELLASFGGAHHGMFDFDKMSQLLSRGGPVSGLQPRRRERIEKVVRTLKAQSFFADPAAKGKAAYGYEFASPEAALAAFRERLPQLVELWIAMQLAEIEVEGNYLEEVHGPLFAGLDEQSVTPQDLQFFPDYLVCVSSAAATEQSALTAALSSGVPLKILVQVDDVLEEAALGKGNFALGLRTAQLASTATMLGDVFVLQSAASNLLQLSHRVADGLRFGGPALFSVFAGSAAANGDLPPYLVAAAAMQSRAFPAFSYDPSAGADLDARFSLENNPQPEVDWPVEPFSYADQDLQAVTEQVAFTFVDFVACDRRYVGHFAPLPRAAWGEATMPVHDWLAYPPDPALGKVPYVLAVDEADLLCRLVVDDRLVRAAQRCRDGWHRLQQMAGIHDARVERAVARERQAWEESYQKVIAEAQASVAAAAPAAEPAKAEAAPAAAPAAEAEPARNPDEAYIETARCSTCNECTLLDPKVFAYNENQQAYIKDKKAGTYRTLVEAAESCQVSVIHPGKPWDSSEEGLEELLERAKPFL